MCIVVFQWQPNAHEQLTLAANRDEFFARPTAAMAWWPDADVLAGRDLQGNGSWLGITRSGRFALLTNVRDPSKRKQYAPSRGLIVREFLEGEARPGDYAQMLAKRATQYEGFNVLVGTIGLRASARELWFLNSNEQRARALPAGVYALSNASLNTPWPKTERLRRAFSAVISLTSDSSTDTLHALLRDDRRADDADLPNTGVPLEWERALSSIFIRHGPYGTRSSTALSVRGDTIEAHEVTHLPEQASAEQTRFRFTL